uniref:Uncharacterized protein n=1 Tax=viral metagenome TaxID=1070528 RepID=A0A6M3K409_9ZZZZ
MNTMKRFALFFALLFLLSGNGFAAEQTIKATEEMVGSGHATKTDTLNRALLVSHSSDGTHKAGLGDLLNGAANLKAFMNAGATAPEWAAGQAMTYHTYDLATASGTQVLTGAGFKPSLAIVFGTIAASKGIGITNGTLQKIWTIIYWGNQFDQGMLDGSVISANISSGNAQSATLAFDTTDGGTLTWTKTGAPTGTYAFVVLWIR